jgi:hypothetical protein
LPGATDSVIDDLYIKAMTFRQGSLIYLPVGKRDKRIGCGTPSSCNQAYI